MQPGANHWEDAFSKAEKLDNLAIAEHDQHLQDEEQFAYVCHFRGYVSADILPE
jgi:hypothetical protein